MMQGRASTQRASTAEQVNDLRAAALGFNDGLAVIVAGFVGLILGPLSMALGK